MTSSFENYMGKPAAAVLQPEAPKPAPVMVEVDRNDIETKAKILVAHDFTETFFPDTDHIKATAKDFYVVWKVKALQNWKVLVSTDIISGQYWEVTYNGNKNETYVDHYVKRHNQAISDESYASMP